MHDIAELTRSIAFRPILSICTDIEIVLIDGTGQIFAQYRCITESGDGFFLTHVNGQRNQSVCCPCRFTLTIDGRSCTCIQCFPFIDFDITQLDLSILFLQRFGIIQTYVRNVGHATSSTDGYSHLFRLTIREFQQTLVTDSRSFCSILPSTVSIYLHQEFFHTLSLCNIFLNEEGIDQSTRLHLVFLRLACLCIPKRYIISNLIISECFGDISRKFLDALYIRFMNQTSFVRRYIQQQDRITTDRLVIDIYQIG